MRHAPSWGRTRSNEDTQGDELGTYVVLLCTALTEHGMTYGPRGLGLRSLGSSRGSHAPNGEDEKVVHRAKPGRCLRYSEKGRYARCDALNRFSVSSSNGENEKYPWKLSIVNSTFRIST